MSRDPEIVPSLPSLRIFLYFNPAVKFKKYYNQNLESGLLCMFYLACDKWSPRQQTHKTKNPFLSCYFWEETQDKTRAQVKEIMLNGYKEAKKFVSNSFSLVATILLTKGSPSLRLAWAKLRLWRAACIVNANKWRCYLVDSHGGRLYRGAVCACGCGCMHVKNIRPCNILTYFLSAEGKEI